MKTTKKAVLVKDLGLKYPNSKSKWKVRYGLYFCISCGEEFKTATKDANSGRVSKCRKCAFKGINKKHGDSNLKINQRYRTMKSRTENKKDKKYKDYGGRGITLCKEWSDNYLVFKEWAINNGYTDKLTIERVDNNKGYSPSNCIFADMATQSMNKRVSIINKFNIDTLSEVCELYEYTDITQKEIAYRMGIGRTSVGNIINGTINYHIKDTRGR